MKKLIVLLLALVVATSAFAQLTFVGYDKAKVNYNSDTKAVAYSDEIRINFSATDKDGMFGVSGRVQGATATDSIFTTVKYMYGWAKFAGGMVQLNAGQINEGGFQFGANEANNMGGNVNSDVEGKFQDIRTQSFELLLNPMAGLTAAVIYTPTGTLVGTDAKYLVKYSVEKLLNAKAEVTFNKSSDAIATAGVEYVGMDNLSAVVGLKMDQLTDPYTGIYSIVGYSMDKLFFEGAGFYDLKDNVAGVKGYYVEGNVEYTEATYSVRGFFGYAKKQTVASGYAFTPGDTPADAGVLGGTATEFNTYKVGAEVSLPIGGGELNIGLAYADKTKMDMPIYLKIAF